MLCIDCNAKSGNERDRDGVREGLMGMKLVARRISIIQRGGPAGRLGDPEGDEASRAFVERYGHLDAGLLGEQEDFLDGPAVMPTPGAMN